MRRRLIEREIERVEGGYVPTAYARKYAQPDQSQPQQAQQEQPEEKFYTSKETAARYPWVEQIEREKAEAAKGASYLVAQGMKQSEADKIIKEQIELTKQANRAAVQNQILQSKLQLEQNTKDLNAHNEFLQAKSAIAKVGFTDADAIERAAKLQSEFGQRLVGTKYEKEFQDSVQNLTSIADRHQQAMHRKFIEDPAKQAEIARVKAVAEQEVQAPYVKAAAEERGKARIDAAALEMAAKQGISYDEAMKALYPGEGVASEASGYKMLQKGRLISSQTKAIEQELKDKYKLTGGVETPSKMLDENGKPTKDPSLAVTAVWLDPKTKKEIARMPEEERSLYANQIRILGAESAKVRQALAGAVPAPQSAPMATTPQAGQRTAVKPSPISEAPATSAAEAGAMPAPTMSPENPYAAEAKSEKAAMLSGQEKARQEKLAEQRKKASVEKYQELIRAERAFNDIKSGKVAPSIQTGMTGGMASISPVSAEEKAKQYEAAKERLIKARGAWFGEDSASLPEEGDVTTEGQTGKMPLSDIFKQ